MNSNNLPYLDLVPLAPLPPVRGPPATAPLMPNSASENPTRSAQPPAEDKERNAPPFTGLNNPRAAPLDNVRFDADTNIPMVPPTPIAF